jgi:hypothetical protein
MNSLTRSSGVFAVLLPAVLFVIAPIAVCHAQSADRVYINGNVYTVDEAFSPARRTSERGSVSGLR